MKNSTKWKEKKTGYIRLSITKWMSFLLLETIKEILTAKNVVLKKFQLTSCDQIKNALSSFLPL